MHGREHLSISSSELITITFFFFIYHPSIFGTSSAMLARIKFLSVPVGFFGSRAALISKARVSVSKDWFLSFKSIAILMEAASKALYVALEIGFSNEYY